MCMETVSRVRPKPEGIGYKAFDVRNGELYGELARGDKVRPVKEWLKARNYSVSKLSRRWLGQIRGKYPTGWHIYKSRRGIENWMQGENSHWMQGEYSYMIKKVRYRRAHTKGTTNGYGVVVAKEIYIIP